jgi:hypothetical protein
VLDRTESTVTTTKKRVPKLSPFAQMLRDKRESLAAGVPLRDFCASRGFDLSMISDMEADRRTAPGTYPLLYKLAGGYGHRPTDRWTKLLLDAAIGLAPAQPKRATPAPGGRGATTRTSAPRQSNEPARRPASSGSRSGRTGPSRSHA